MNEPPIDLSAERVRRLPIGANPSASSVADTIAVALVDERVRVADGGAPSACCILLVERADGAGRESMGAYYGGPGLQYREDAAEKLLRKAVQIIVDCELQQRGLG